MGNARNKRETRGEKADRLLADWQSSAKVEARKGGDQQLPRGGGVHYTALHSTPGTLPPVKSITSGNGVTAPETGPGQKQSKLIAKTGEKKRKAARKNAGEKGRQAGGSCCCCLVSLTFSMLFFMQQQEKLQQQQQQQRQQDKGSGPRPVPGKCFNFPACQLGTECSSSSHRLHYQRLTAVSWLPCRYVCMYGDQSP